MQKVEAEAQKDLSIKIQVKAELLGELCESIRELTWKLDQPYHNNFVREYLQNELTWKQDTYKRVAQDMKDLLES